MSATKMNLRDQMAMLEALPRSTEGRALIVAVYRTSSNYGDAQDRA